MNELQFLLELIRRAKVAHKGRSQFTHLIAIHLPEHLHHSLAKVSRGPVDDEEVPGKSQRKELLELGLAVGIFVKGEPCTAATSLAYYVVKRINELE